VANGTPGRDTRAVGSGDELFLRMISLFRHGIMRFRLTLKAQLKGRLIIWHRRRLSVTALVSAAQVRRHA